MRDEIAAMGARTPHELMRCAEVTFIRDCAEMAARASLARTESRWGLYHERLDHPAARRRGLVPPPRPAQVPVRGDGVHGPPGGALPGPRRRVHPGRRPLPPPRRGPRRNRWRRRAPREAAPWRTAGARPDRYDRPPRYRHGHAAPHRACSSSSPSPRTSPGLSALTPYLTDPEPSRSPDGRHRADGDGAAGHRTGTRRHARATPTPASAPPQRPHFANWSRRCRPEPALRDGLVAALSEADPVVRAAALDVLRALRLGDTGLFTGSLSDADIAVRIAAVRALVSVDAAGELARAATADPSREVRVTIAKALATVTAGQPDGTTSAGPVPDMVLSALAELIDDPDALVRAAAYEALGTTGCPAPLAARAEAALSDPAWQVRAGAGTALSLAAPGRRRTRPRQGPRRPQRRRPQGRRARPDPAPCHRGRPRGPGHGDDGPGRGRQGLRGPGTVGIGLFLWITDKSGTTRTRARTRHGRADRPGQGPSAGVGPTSN